MGVVTWFIVLFIITAILVFLSALFSTFASQDALDSIYYNSDTSIRTAHQYSAIAMAMAWATLIILIILVIVAAVTGSFSGPSVTCTSNSKSVYGTSKFTFSLSTELLIIIIMIILLLVVIVYGILQLLASLQLSGVAPKDARANSATTYSMVSCITTLISLFTFIPALILYIMIYRKHKAYAAGNKRYMEPKKEKCNRDQDCSGDRDVDVSADTGSTEDEGDYYY